MLDSFGNLRVVVSGGARDRAQRHAAEFARMGFEVRIEACGSPAAGDPLAARRPDPGGAAAFLRLAETFRPDVIHDLGGPLCVVHAAAIRSIPVVSLAGPENWFRAPGSLAERLAHRALTPLARAAHIPEPRWEAVRESRDYESFVRQSVRLFVVRDARARACFISHGVPASRVVQCDGDEERVAGQVGALFGALAGRRAYADAAD
jgi:hypothetical protein